MDFHILSGVIIDDVFCVSEKYRDIRQNRNKEKCNTKYSLLLQKKGKTFFGSLSQRTDTIKCLN